ncbi:hypothetical protein WICPIJ_008789 [Wickerhamomyces pijperi]|uniref:Uncharacterized protein n=1 Tax=Wickerhamomyces pijperi TaxID=599730 RepID=A0A9P8THE5_WICPI|nr:hypothetical protein WICPIJ_008789 [Wickerhamomyces pijperi]
MEPVFKAPSSAAFTALLKSKDLFNSSTKGSKASITLAQGLNDGVGLQGGEMVNDTLATGNQRGTTVTVTDQSVQLGDVWLLLNDLVDTGLDVFLEVVKAEITNFRCLTTGQAAQSVSASNNSKTLLNPRPEVALDAAETLNRVTENPSPLHAVIKAPWYTLTGLIPYLLFKMSTVSLVIPPRIKLDTPPKLLIKTTISSSLLNLTKERSASVESKIFGNKWVSNSSLTPGIGESLWNPGSLWIPIPNSISLSPKADSKALPGTLAWSKETPIVAMLSLTALAN